MPKERVFGTERLPTDSGDDIPLVEVRWNRQPDSYLSIVTRLRNCEVSPPGEDILAAYGLHVELERDGVNLLIRHLRRARDQAFGRDE